MKSSSDYIPEGLTEHNSRTLPWGSARQIKHLTRVRLIIRHLGHRRMTRRAMVQARGIALILLEIMVAIVLMGGGPPNQAQGQIGRLVYGS